MLPYPSDFFLVNDNSLTSGHRVQHPRAAQPITEVGYGALPDSSKYKIDGFSPFSPILAALPKRVAASSIVPIHGNYQHTLEDSSTTLIIDAETGQRVPHFVDLDPRALENELQAIVIHPLEPLSWSRRYLVVLKGLKDASGQLIAQPPGVKEALSSEWFKPVLDSLRKHSLDGDFQLAFAFTTGSKQYTQKGMRRMIALADEWLKSEKSVIKITKNDSSDTGGDWRKLRGTFTAPQYLDDPDSRRSSLKRDSSAEIIQNGVAEVPFTVVIPGSLRDQFEPGRVIMHGHGFFGNQSNVRPWRFADLARRSASIILSLDWRGLSTSDLSHVSAALAENPRELVRQADQVRQGMVNRYVLLKLLKRGFSDVPEFRRPLQGVGTSTNSSGSNAGLLLYEPGEPIHFLGVSAGAILGTTILSLDQTIDRAVLNVGGVGLSKMMYRSVPFAALMLFLDDALPSPLDQQKFTTAFQPYFDRFDPIAYAGDLKESLKKLPDRKIVLQVGIADTSVPNFASFYLARQLGLKALPHAEDLWQIDSYQDESSALAIYNHGFSTEIYQTPNLMLQVNPVHEEVINSATARRQILRLFQDGVIEHPCEGPCMAP